MNSKEINDLKFENENLKKELNKLKKTRKNKKQFFLKAIKKIGILFIGSNLVDSFKDLIENYNKTKKIDTDSLSYVLAHTIWRVTRVGIFAIIIGLLPTFLLLHQNFLINSQNKKIDSQNSIIKDQSYLLEAQRRSNLQFEISEILNRLDNELSDTLKNKRRQLSSSLKSRIIAVTTTMKPYRSLRDSILSDKNYSYERGMLFCTLFNSNLYIGDLKEILKKGNFNNMFIENITLSSENLKSIKDFSFKSCALKNVYFENILFENIIFDDCNINGFSIRKKKFSRYTINNSLCNNIDFYQVDWVTLNNSTLSNSNFHKLKKNDNNLVINYTNNCKISKSIWNNTSIYFHSPNIKNKDSLSIDSLLILNGGFSTTNLKTIKFKNILLNIPITPKNNIIEQKIHYKSIKLKSDFNIQKFIFDCNYEPYFYGRTECPDIEEITELYSYKNN